MKKTNIVLSIAMTVAIEIGSFGNMTFAKNIGELDGLVVKCSSWTWTDALIKTTNKQEAVVNLNNDGGYAWLTCKVYNGKKNKKVGSVCLQRGTRAAFSTSGAEKNKSYRLALQKTYDNVTSKVQIIDGSWSPDN